MISCGVCPTNQLGFRHSFCSFLFVLLWLGYFRWDKWFYLLFDLFCCRHSLLHSSFDSLNSSAPENNFYVFYLFVILKFRSWIVSLILLNCVSLFSCSFFSFLKTVIMNSPSTKSQNVMPLSLVIGELLFGDDMFPWCFPFEVQTPPQSLLFAFIWGILFVGAVVFWGFSAFV